MSKFDKYFNAYENRKYPHTLGPFDNSGVPLFNTANLNLGKEITYHPIVIIQYGLACYNLFISNNNEKFKNQVFICAQWLIENLEEQNGLYRWPYHFDLKFPYVKAPWYSGMCQGQALSLLSRAYTLSNDNKYIKPIAGVVDTIYTKIEKGGCSTVVDKDFIFIQEIANNKHNSYILNGALYAIIGIIESSNVIILDTLKIKKLLISIVKLLPKYDTGYWSKYSLGIRFNLADEYYHNVHIQQMRLIHKMTNIDEFLIMATKFQSYTNTRNPFNKIMRWLYLNINRVFRFLNLERLLFKKVEFG